MDRRRPPEKVGEVRLTNYVKGDKGWRGEVFCC
jgi:hypothetical protein